MCLFSPLPDAHRKRKKGVKMWNIARGKEASWNNHLQKRKQLSLKLDSHNSEVQCIRLPTTARKRSDNAYMKERKSAAASFSWRTRSHIWRPTCNGNRVRYHVLSRTRRSRQETARDFITQAAPSLHHLPLPLTLTAGHGYEYLCSRAKHWCCLSDKGADFFLLRVWRSSQYLD